MSCTSCNSCSLPARAQQARSELPESVVLSLEEFAEGNAVPASLWMLLRDSFVAAKEKGINLPKNMTFFDLFSTAPITPEDMEWAETVLQEAC